MYLYQVEGTTLEFWVVAVTTISYMPALARTAVQTNQKMPSTALYYIGTAVSGIVFASVLFVQGWSCCSAGKS